jgi:hypothetical protein
MYIAEIGVGNWCSRPEAMRDRDFWPAVFCAEGTVRWCVGGGVAQPPVWCLIITFSHTALPRTIVYLLSCTGVYK